MARFSKQKVLFAAQELREHLNTANFRAQKPEKAFISWYKTSRFDASSKLQILDGKSDGGVDALVEVDGRTVVVQSKYEVKPRISNVTRDEIAGFEKIALRFLKSEQKDDFDRWLVTVRPEIIAKYKVIYQQIRQNPHSVSFLFITTKRFDQPASNILRVEDISDIAPLWELYKDDFTPPAESIELSLEDVWNCPSDGNRFTTYVGLADVRDFLRLMDNDRNERLFAQNVRTDLHSKINQAIKVTYEKEPETFWLGNNGIYIVCKSVESHGNHYTLRYPSIINGSQTLHSVHASGTRHACKILVRVLEMDMNNDQNLLSFVIRRTNTQNPMKLINLSAHDPYQKNIARYLDQYNIFYERREKEWQNEKKTFMSKYRPIDIKTLAQWLSTLKAEIGLGRARSRVSDLFQGDYYKKIFQDFDRNLNSTKYHDLVTLVWSGFFIQNLIYYYPGRFRQYPKIAQLMLVKAVYDSLVLNADLEEDIESLTSHHLFGSRNIPRPLIALIKKSIVKLIQLQKREQRKEPNIDFSNFFKRDDLCRRAYKTVFSRRALKKISNMLRKNKDKIK